MNIQELSELISLHGEAVYSFCRRLAPSRTDADDLYQETFLKATELCRKIDRYNNPKAFLCSIALRLWKDSRRKSARRQRIAPTQALVEELDESLLCGEDAQPEEIAVSNERTQIVRRAVDTLDEPYRIPLYLYYTVELSIAEIASILKLPQGTVKSRLYHARKAIQTILEANHYE